MRAKQPIHERIERRIVLTPFGCWEWQGSRDRDGYGVIKVDGRPRAAHRIAYAEYIGPIPEGEQIDHLCRNRACVNPEHHEAVTSKVNTRRGVRSTRLLCPNGHRRTKANTYTTPSGHRTCRPCHRAADDRFKAAARAA